MANEVKKVNNVAITDIKNINGQTDANIKKINTKEFTGLSAGTWSASSASLGTARSNFFSAQGSTRAAMAIIGGNGTSGLSDRENSEEEYNGASDSISSGQAISISGIMCGADSATSAVVGGGTSSGSYVSGQDAYEFGSGSWSSITNPSKVYFQAASSAGTSGTDCAFVGGTSSGDCDMNGDYHMSWDGSSWTEETNFIGAVYGPAYAFGGGSWSSITNPSKVYFQAASSAGTSGTDCAFVGGTSSGDCDMNGDYHMSWDGSSWTEETNFIGAVYGPAYAFGGGSAHDSYRITCGYYSTHATSCSRGSLNKNYTYEGTTWSLSSDNAPASGNGGVGGGTLNDHYHTIKNYSGSSSMQLYDGSARS